MGLAICLWVCTLPLVILAAIIFSSPTMAWSGAILSLIIFLSVCFAICTWGVFGEGNSQKH